MSDPWPYVLIGVFVGLFIGSELARRAYKRSAELLSLSLAVAELRRQIERDAA